MSDEELKAIVEYMSSLPIYERWKGLSPLALRLKSAFLSHLTGAAGNAAQTCSGQKRRGDEDAVFLGQDRSRRKRRTETHAFGGQETIQDTASSLGYSQPPTPASHSHMIPNMADSLQVLAEVATTTAPVSDGLTRETEYSQSLANAPFLNEMNDFDISAGHPLFIDGMNNFDISAGLHAIPQPPPLGNTSFTDGMNDFNNSIGPNSVPRLPSLGDDPFVDGMNNFDISAGVRAASQPSPGDMFANRNSNIEIPHEAFIDNSSVERSMNNIEILAGQNIPNPMGGARFQLPVDTTRFQHVVGA